MNLFLACPYCSSAYLQFDHFASPLGLAAALAILGMIAGVPLYIILFSAKLDARPRKNRARRTAPYLLFVVLWIWFLSRMSLLEPDYNRHTNIILFSDIILYLIFLPFIAAWNYVVTQLAFFAPQWISNITAILWTISPPVIYGWLSNRYDRDIRLHKS